jgi:HD-GYP domain-containing protein (c-di-GMP phosphodiesterase class II)
VLTARDSYRKPVSSEAAVAELHRAAGSQLDPEIVEAFTRLLAAKDISFRHADDADFDAEIALGERVREYARGRRHISA